MIHYLRRAIVGGASVGAILAPVGVMAQEVPGEDNESIIVTAARTQQNIRDIPASVEIVTEDDLAASPGMLLTDVLKKNASVDVIEYPGGQSGLGLRGFRPEFSGVNQRVLTLVNGRPSGAPSVGSVASAGLARVEVLKGSASAIYGPSAMGGVINFITRESRGDISGRAMIGYGSYDTLHVEGSVGGALSDRFDFDLAARHYKQNDDFKLGKGGHTYDGFVQGHGVERPNTAFEQNSFYGRMAFRFAEDWRIQGHLMVYDSPITQTPGAETDGVGNQGDRIESTISGDIGITGKIGSHDLTALYYRAVDEGDLIRKTPGVPPYLTSDRKTRFQGVQVQDNWAVTDGVNLIVGADWGLIKNESGAYNTDGSRRGAYTPNFERESLGIFADATAHLFEDRLVVNIGGRYDWIEATVLPTPLRDDLTPGSSKFGTFNPRAGIVFHPLPNGPLRIHASAGTGFVVPEASDVAGLTEQIVGGQTRISRGNPDLKPEKSESYDIGIGYEGKHFGADVTYFLLNVKDRISTIITTNTSDLRVTTYENAFGSKSEGLEVSMRFDPIGLLTGQSSALSADLSFTHFFTREEELATGLSTLRNVAKTRANFGLGYDDGVRMLRIGGRYVEGVQDNDFSVARYFTNGAGGLYEYDSFAVFDLSGSWKLNKSHMVSFKMDNITDKYYYEKGDYPLSGRRFMASYTFSF